MRKRNPLIYILGIVVIVLAAALIISGSSSKSVSHKTPLSVVAAENFWGSLVSQLGGSKVKVKSIVSDPNADPHEYESNNTDARAFASADYVIQNGAGYDSWSDKLLSAQTNAGRKVLKVADLLGKKEGDNPHFWYNPDYVNRVVYQMERDLAGLDPKDSAYYQSNYNRLMSSLAVYQGRINQIRSKYSGTKVAATEDIFVYLANASGLNLISPSAFIEAVAEGNDPPTASVVQFQQQLNSKSVKLLVYNEQTITPLTDSIKKLASQNGIPIVGISETVQPPNQPFQDWMNSEIVNLSNTLNSVTAGQ